MLSKISIFRHTKHSFSNEIKHRLGRGYLHAARLYTEWFKQGDFGSLTWVEPQALSLVQEIIENVECAFPQEAIVKQAGSTSKFLLAVEGGWQTESVLIPMESSTTICISSQVGCRMGCAFCETGRMGLLRHLKAEEIIAQVVHARYVLKTEIRNIVFMGMGEPLDNYDEVMLAVKVLTDPSGLQFGTSRITISTSGKVDAIYRMMEEMSPALNLAVSVNAPNDAIRQKLMPVNRKWNMTALKEAMIAYCAHPRREILIEYVLISGVNAELQHADVLAEYLKGLRVRVNLIPYNPQSLDRFSPPKSEEIEAFMCRMKGHGYQTLLRHTKGQGIMAACGQLGNMSLRAKLRGLPISTKESMNPPEKKSLSVIE